MKFATSLRVLLGFEHAERSPSVSRINDRDRQLNMLFSDADLRKPRHEEIMHWLDAWARDPDNVRPFMTHVSMSRCDVEEAEIDPTSLQALPENQRSWPQEQLRRDRPRKETDCREAWPDEPEREIAFEALAWEEPMHDDGRVVGFCDLRARYLVGDVLYRITKHSYHLEQAPDSYGPRWRLEALGERRVWYQRNNYLHLFFEVKTEIPSVGELMRQIQLYRSCGTYRRTEGYRDTHGRTLFLVVAPPSNEAATVCRGNGIPFVEWRPE